MLHGFGQIRFEVAEELVVAIRLESVSTSFRNTDNRHFISHTLSQTYESACEMKRRLHVFRNLVSTIVYNNDSSEKKRVESRSKGLRSLCQENVNGLFAYTGAGGMIGASHRLEIRNSARK